jgi:hypothetical protein
MRRKTTGDAAARQAKWREQNPTFPKAQRVALALVAARYPLRGSPALRAVTREQRLALVAARLRECLTPSDRERVAVLWGMTAKERQTAINTLLERVGKK